MSRLVPAAAEPVGGGSAQRQPYGWQPVSQSPVYAAAPDIHTTTPHVHAAAPHIHAAAPHVHAAALHVHAAALYLYAAALHLYAAALHLCALNFVRRRFVILHELEARD